MKVTISVTAEDIKNGEATTITKCPIALAASRCFEGRVMIGSNGISVENLKDLVFMPSSASDFVKKFDNGEIVYPFTFEVDTEIHPPNVQIDFD